MPAKTINSIPPDKTRMAEQDPAERARNFNEVALGYTPEEALREAERCLQCKKPRCIAGCPVGIDIPGFIAAVAEGDVRKSYGILRQTNALPAVCGRVCPQETQCEALCIIGRKVEPVGVGRLERYVADVAIAEGWEDEPEIRPAERRAAIVGSGPAGLACAGDLARAGVKVTIYEAFHVPGGVLQYGIPEFRLPKAIVDLEIDGLRKLGVTIEVNRIIGQVLTVRQLMEEKGYDTVFLGAGAGFPKFMGIPGESLNGVYSANEFLTRVNLMRGYRHPTYDTPVGMGKTLAVIGAGNTAMDSARTALRMGAERVSIVYRRSETECPARLEEMHHAIEEGVEMNWLTNPVCIHGKDGWVTGMECIRMDLGEPDDSGRRRPVPKPGTEFRFDVETVVYALGTSANPILGRTTPGLKLNKWGYIEADPETCATSVPGVYAGGDIVTGSATVILAMGAGRAAAASMLEYMGVTNRIAPVGRQP